MTGTTGRMWMEVNAALAPYPEWQGLTIEAVLRRLAEVPLAICEAVRNQGGGHANHQFFWKVIRPGGSPMPADLRAAIERDLGSVDAFKQKFEAAGAGRFGSGWAFLVGDPATGRLEILTLPNHDSVLTIGKFGLLCCDLWEHAYYLTYRNRRAEWLRAWWGNRGLAGRRATAYGDALRRHGGLSDCRRAARRNTFSPGSPGSASR